MRSMRRTAPLGVRTSIIKVLFWLSAGPAGDRSIDGYSCFLTRMRLYAGTGDRRRADYQRNDESRRPQPGRPPRYRHRRVVHVKPPLPIIIAEEWTRAGWPHPSALGIARKLGAECTLPCEAARSGRLLDSTPVGLYGDVSPSCRSVRRQARARRGRRLWAQAAPSPRGEAR